MLRWAAGLMLLGVATLAFAASAFAATNAKPRGVLVASVKHSTETTLTCPATTVEDPPATEAECSGQVTDISGEPTAPTGEYQYLSYRGESCGTSFQEREGQVGGDGQTGPLVTTFTERGHYSVQLKYEGDETHEHSLSACVAILVAAAPSVSISTLVEGTYPVGENLEAGFSCSEGAEGPGLEACEDDAGIGLNDDSADGLFADGPNSDSTPNIPTGAPGKYTYTASARSHDGLKATAAVKYTVAAPPEAEIEAPKSGGVYSKGAKVPTEFSCAESEFGTGLESCSDGVVSGAAGKLHGALATSESGTHEYTVTATSKDGQVSHASISYTVAEQLKPHATSCSGVYTGSGASVTVPAGASCTLLPGTKVSGGVQAQHAGSTLIDDGAVIGGTVQLDAAASFELYGGGSIGGNLIVEGLTGGTTPIAARPAKVPPAAVMCDTVIRGNVQILKNGADAPIGIEGCEGSPALTIGGYLQAQGNAAPLTLSSNKIGRYLQVWANKAQLTIGDNEVGATIHVYSNTKDAGSTLTGNSSGEACELQTDSPPIDGTLNSVKPGHSNMCNREA